MNLHNMLKTGGDPRRLPEYAALRDELNKLAHPARPDVNWHHAETCAMALFERNGVELQTAAWYTLVRCQLAGIAGLNQGLALLMVLITRQWGSLWPQQVHRRIGILSGLSRRLQQHLRTITLSRADLNALYQAGSSLSAIQAALQGLAPEHDSGLDTLQQQLDNAIVRLENRETGDTVVSSVVMPTPLMFRHPPPGKSRPQRQADAVQPEPKNVAVAPVRASVSWKSFMAGMLVMLLAGSGIQWGIRALNTHPQQAALQAATAPLPEVLPEAQLQTIKQQNPEWLRNQSEWVSRTQQQLTRLSALPPGWSYAYGSSLVRQAQTLWPESSQTDILAHQWQQQLEASALSAAKLEGWHQGMVRLQQLTDQLNALDEKKGRYMTVSELKTAVFAVTQSLRNSVPAEEQLRQLSQISPPQPIPAELRAQTEFHLKQLLISYTLLTDHPGNER